MRETGEAGEMPPAGAASFLAQRLTGVTLVLTCIAAVTCRLGALRWGVEGLHDPAEPGAALFDFNAVRAALGVPGARPSAASHPLLAAAAAAVHWLLSRVGIIIDVHTTCTLLVPALGPPCCLAMFALGCEAYGDTGVGLAASAFMALLPATTGSASFGAQGVAMFLLLLAILYYVRALKSGREAESAWYAAAASAALALMSLTWRPFSLFLSFLVPFHVAYLCATDNHTPALWATYTSLFALGLVPTAVLPDYIALTLSHTYPASSPPFAATSPYPYSLTSPAFLIASLLFLLLQRQHFFALRPKLFSRLAALVLVGAGLVLLAAPGMGVPPWEGSIWHKISAWKDAGGRGAAGLNTCDSVFLCDLKHRQPSAWAALFVDFHLSLFLIPAGLIRRGEAATLVTIYTGWALFFAGLMRSLTSLLAPAACLTSAVALCALLRPFLRTLRRTLGPAPTTKKGKNSAQRDYEDAGVAVFVVGGALLVAALFVWHCSWVAGHLSQSSALTVPGTNAEGTRLDMGADFVDALAFVRQHTPPDATVAAWWEYGDAIAVLGERVPMVSAQDSACMPANASRAAQPTPSTDADVGSGRWSACMNELAQSLLAPAGDAAQRLGAIGADYVMLVFGGFIGFAGDDLNRLPAMLRLARCAGGEGVAGERAYLADIGGALAVGATAPAGLRASALYRLSYARFPEVLSEYGRPKGFDRARRQVVGGAPVAGEDTELPFEEVFTSKHWLVRVFRVAHAR